MDRIELLELDAQIKGLVGYTDIKPHWVEVTPYRERLYERVQRLNDEVERIKGLLDEEVKNEG